MDRSSGHCRSFDSILDTVAELEVTATNDYWTCESWCEKTTQRKERLLGICLHHLFLPTAPPLPERARLPKHRYRIENRPDPPPPLTPGGPIRLRSEGSMIAAITLASEKHVLFLQLRQMLAVGPELRQVFE